ncbi:aminotransferase class V-fold PLP-dependent enzyme [Nocardioides albidus]|uniref:Aminotransferase class V-fold PLP-dependent enzyme n=1 Tax=Nocardioides albidus TaxID=1517589 RepID=A0A5C4W185_9ACTN|nr:aminotransferase class I/II-fold pyridoxal phosphate-dependent enzyme [Nocardioides albidus]TNM41970.1 aminotransferase class V-fold PLP-dependent enzyme [Nocardioides albidus]
MKATHIWGDERRVTEAAVKIASARISSPSDPKATARPISALRADAGTTITPAGIGVDQAFSVFQDVIAPATRAQDDPLNLAYIPAAPTRAALAFDAVVSSFNIFGGTWEAGAGAIFAENEALAWLVSLLGWPEEAGGCFVSGGTSGNLSALVTARHTALARRGGRPEGGWKIACTSGAHSSILADARVMDVGVVEVPEGERGQLTGAALRAATADEPGVFAVVASAGTTNAGIIDDLAEIADVCEEHGLWLHVDGAYGGAGLAAPSARARFDGIERADSFIVDPHKWLFAPYDCCALLYRDPDLARAAHSQHASYLDRIDREAWNPTDLAVHLSRRVRGLPFWFSLAVHGTDRYVAAGEQTLTTTRAVADAIKESANLRLLLEPDLSVLLFDRPGWTRDDYYAWSDELSRAGRILCVPTSWRGETVLRLAFVNPATDPAAVIDILTTTTA